MKKKQLIILGVLALVAILFFQLVLAVYMDNLTINVTMTQNNPLAHGAITIAFDDGHLVEQYVNAWSLMKQRGLVGTFYVVSDWTQKSYKMGPEELLDLELHGCEIASHSKTHPDMTKLTEAQLIEEISGSKATLEAMGLTVTNFAYPSGYRNSTTDAMVLDVYDSLRGKWAVQQFPISIREVYSYAAYSENDLDELKTWIDKVHNERGYSVIYFHSVKDIDTGSTIISKNDFAAFLDYVIAKNVAVITVREALTVGQNVNPLDGSVSLYYDSLLQHKIGNELRWIGNAPNSYYAIWLKHTYYQSITLAFTADLPDEWILMWDYSGNPVDNSEELKIVFQLTKPGSESATQSFQIQLNYN